MDLARAHAVQMTESDGPVVVLGHGLGGDQGQWAPLVEHLAVAHRVVTFDLAGSGASDPAAFSPERHASIEGFADDLSALCAELGLRGVTYVGHSMSGMAGALASVADPGLFDRLVLIGASASYLDDEAAGYVGGFTTAAVEDLLGAITADFDLWAGGFAGTVMGNADRPELAGEFARSLARYGPETALTVFRAAFLGDYRSVVGRVAVPTLVLSTTADPAVPVDAARALAAAIPGAELRLLDVQGHFPHVVAPDLIAAELDRVLGAP